MTAEEIIAVSKYFVSIGRNHYILMHTNALLFQNQYSKYIIYDDACLRTPKKHVKLSYYFSPQACKQRLSSWLKKTYSRSLKCECVKQERRKLGDFAFAQ